MVCILEVLGDDFEPKEFLAMSSLPVDTLFLKGIPPTGRSKPAETNGFTCCTSVKEGLSLLVDDTIIFLKQHQDDLRRLSEMKAVESLDLDFGYECRLGPAVAMQGEYLPPELLLLAGSLRIGICLSLYPAIEDEAKEC